MLQTSSAFACRQGNYKALVWELHCRRYTSMKGLWHCLGRQLLQPHILGVSWMHCLRGHYVL